MKQIHGAVICHCDVRGHNIAVNDNQEAFLLIYFEKVECCSRSSAFDRKYIPGKVLSIAMEMWSTSTLSKNRNFELNTEIAPLRDHDRSPGSHRRRTMEV